MFFHVYYSLWCKEQHQVFLAKYHIEGAVPSCKILLKNFGASLNKFVVDGYCLYLCTIKTQLVISYID